MRPQPDELAFWKPVKAAFVCLEDALSATTRRKYHDNLCGLGQRMAEKNDLKTANFLFELAGYDPVEEEPKGPKLVIDNTKIST